MNNRLTMDYGVRLVQQQPQYDELGQASNFLPEKWTTGQAPLLYAAGCAGASPCSGANRQAMDPRTGQLLGPTSVLAIGTIVPGTGTRRTLYSFRARASRRRRTPGRCSRSRRGSAMAYDLSGRQTFVLRGGVGLFFDRPDGNAIFPQVQNPPTYKNITVRYGTLQTLGAVGSRPKGRPRWPSTSTTASCRPPHSGTPACRCCCRGPRRSISRTSATTATTCCRT